MSILFIYEICVGKIKTPSKILICGDNIMVDLDVERVKVVVNLAKWLAKLNETNQCIDVVEFSGFLNQEDALIFLEEYSFYVQQRRSNNHHLVRLD